MGGGIAPAQAARRPARTGNRRAREGIGSASLTPWRQGILTSQWSPLRADHPPSLRAIALMNQRAMEPHVIDRARGDPCAAVEGVIQDDRGDAYASIWRIGDNHILQRPYVDRPVPDCFGAGGSDQPGRRDKRDYPGGSERG